MGLGLVGVGGDAALAAIRALFCLSINSSLTESEIVKVFLCPASVPWIAGGLVEHAKWLRKFEGTELALKAGFLLFISLNPSRFFVIKESIFLPGPPPGAALVAGAVVRD